MGGNGVGCVDDVGWVMTIEVFVWDELIAPLVVVQWLVAGLAAGGWRLGGHFSGDLGRSVGS